MENSHIDKDYFGTAIRSIAWLSASVKKIFKYFIGLNEGFMCDFVMGIQQHTDLHSYATML